MAQLSCAKKDQREALSALPKPGSPAKLVRWGWSKGAAEGTTFSTGKLIPSSEHFSQIVSEKQALNGVLAQQTGTC